MENGNSDIALYWQRRMRDKEAMVPGYQTVCVCVCVCAHVGGRSERAEALEKCQVVYYVERRGKGF